MRFSKKEEYLRQKDRKLKKIIDENGHIVFKPVKENQFDTLVGIVISQFISTKAADSIFKKIRQDFSTNYLNEKHFQQLSVNDIKKLGLSLNKAKTIKQLSNLYLNKTIDDLTELDTKKLTVGTSIQGTEIGQDLETQIITLLQGEQIAFQRKVNQNAQLTVNSAQGYTIILIQDGKYQQIVVNGGGNSTITITQGSG